MQYVSTPVIDNKDILYAYRSFITAITQITVQIQRESARIGEPKRALHIIIGLFLLEVPPSRC